MKSRLALVLFFFSIYSCSNSINHQLNGVEKEISDRPDSALFHLEQISQKRLRTQRSRAKYALLKSMALDKNYIDVADDSLINIAVNYYSYSRCQPQYKMLAYYYKGLVQRNGANYPAAIISFEQAVKQAAEQGSLRYLGLIYRNIADIYNLSNNNKEAKEYHQKAVDAFILNKDSLYAQYALYSLAVDLMNDKSYPEARKLFQELIAGDDETLTNNSKLCCGQICVEQEDSLEKAIELYRHTPLTYYQMLDYGFRSRAHMLAGQLDSAEYWIQLGFQLADSNEKKATLEFLQADIDFVLNRKELAFKRVKRAAHVQDSLTRILLYQSLSTAQRDYYMHEVATQNMRMRRQKASVIIWSIALLFATALIFMFIREKVSRKEQLLRESLLHLMLKKNKVASALVGTLFLEKYAHVQDLPESYLGKKGEQQIASLKKDLSSLYTNEKAFSDLYTMLDTYVDNIMQKFTRQIPSVSNDNVKTTALFFAGIPDELIQYIVKRQSVGSLKTYRSRLRTIIKRTSCADEQLFLSHLERQPRKTL